MLQPAALYVCRREARLFDNEALSFVAERWRSRGCRPCAVLTRPPCDAVAATTGLARASHRRQELRDRAEAQFVQGLRHCGFVVVHADGGARGAADAVVQAVARLADAQLAVVEATWYSYPGTEEAADEHRAGELLRARGIAVTAWPSTLLRPGDLPFDVWAGQASEPARQASAPSWARSGAHTKHPIPLAFCEALSQPVVAPHCVSARAADLLPDTMSRFRKGAEGVPVPRPVPAPPPVTTPSGHVALEARASGGPAIHAVACVQPASGSSEADAWARLAWLCGARSGTWLQATVTGAAAAVDAGGGADVGDDSKPPPIMNYAAQRSCLATQPCQSQLSTALALGTLSARSVWWAVQWTAQRWPAAPHSTSAAALGRPRGRRHHSRLHSADHGPSLLLSHLLIRDFFAYSMLKHGTRLFRLRGLRDRDDRVGSVL